MSNTLRGRIEVHKRRYKRSLEDLALCIQRELARLEDKHFEALSGLDSSAFGAIQESNRLRSLLEVDLAEGDRNDF